MAKNNKRRTQIERRDEAERRMLEAGAFLLAEQGLSGLTLAKVGEQAGYSRGLPTHHFGSKSEFEDKLFQFLLGEYHVVADETAPDGLAKLADIVRSYFERSLRDPVHLYIVQITLSDSWAKLVSQNSARLNDVLQQKNKTIGIFEKQLEVGIENGEIRSGIDIKSTALFLVAAICGVLTEWLSDRTIDLIQTGDAIVDTMTNGIVAVAEGRDTPSPIAQSALARENDDLKRLLAEAMLKNARLASASVD